MQPRNLYVLLIVVFAAGVTGIVVWLGNRPKEQPVEVEEVVDFPVRDFFYSFDLDLDGQITAEEFNQSFEHNKGKLNFSRGPGQPLMNAREIFEHLDENKDGLLSRADKFLEPSHDAAWMKFKQDSAAQGFETRIWGGRWVRLNPDQSATLNREAAAFERNKAGDMAVTQIPFGGQFFAVKYFAARRFVEVVTANGETLRGFLSEDREKGRLALVTPDARLLILKPGEGTITEKPAAAEIEYVKLVESTPYDDPAANLRLARRCAELGLRTEARMMFARVLIYEPANEEALNALDLKLEGGMFVRKGN